MLILPKDCYYSGANIEQRTLKLSCLLPPFVILGVVYRSIST